MKPCFYKATICILFKWFYLNCGQEVRMKKFNKHIYGVPYIVNLTRLFIILSNVSVTYVTLVPWRRERRRHVGGPTNWDIA